MTPMYDLHTHCTYCDGQNTPEQMVQAAIEKGFCCIGFSSHGFTGFDTSYCMAAGAEADYKKEVLSLREKYKGKIEIYLGCEVDYEADTGAAGYDYVIGSVHYLRTAGGYLPVDLSKEVLTTGVAQYYGGDFYAAAAAYYRSVADLWNKTHCDITGHFDLITKYNEAGALFDESDRRYRLAALAAADALLDRDVRFEVNTGAITRGHRTVPYPAAFILRHIAERKGKIVLSGDTHAAAQLGREWKTAVDYALSCGFKTASRLTNHGFTEFALSAK